MAVALTATASAVIAVAPGPVEAQGAPYRKCPYVGIERRLSAAAVVLETKRLSCGAARQVVRRYGGDDNNSRAIIGGPGGRFRLGNYRCTVYYGPGPYSEDWKATCAKSGHAFKVAYGA